MADPISVVGLVAGLASLGIQVCGGITHYLDAVKCHADDVASARRQARSFKDVLQIIQETVTLVDSDHRIPATAVVECIKSCEAELKILESFVSELTGDATSPANFKGKIKEQTKKLSYAFNRSKLDQLEAKLARANGIFQTAVQSLGFPLGSLAWSQDSEVVVGRLLAKPSNLRALCDEVTAPLEEAQTGLKRPSRHLGAPLLRGSVTGSGTNCICRRRQRYHQQRLRLGALELYDETTVAEEHLPDCQISQVLPRHRHRSLGVKYTGAARLLNRAVNMAFSMTFGAGGFSIAPVFTYYATVDGQTAPAFQLLNIMRDAIHHFRDSGLTHWNTLGETALKKILKLFRERKASPTDVDSMNRSLLHLTGHLRMAEEAEDLGLCDGNVLDRLTGRVIEQLRKHHVPVPAALLSFNPRLESLGGGRHLAHIVYDAEEIQEIEEEQAALLETLEDLAQEFEDKVTDTLEQESTEPLAALGEFWTGYWCNRMEEVLDDLNGATISDEERLAAERIGVRWDDEPDDESDEEDRSDIKYWYRRIDEIA
ncbi:hypothetical protein DL771_009667 [Monosporascus sp. 5C6A]|nr:hypothetical protein DL771_009667 [Monosporascus sp. 5C6A]